MALTELPQLQMGFRDIQTANTGFLPAPPPSLLTVVLDTNPHAWELLSSTTGLTLSNVVANLLVFINAHLAFNHVNQVAFIASHVKRAVFLYPTPPKPTPNTNTTANGSAPNGTDTINGTMGDSNKYRPFARIEHEILTNLRALISSTTTSTLRSTTTTMMAGALTTALAYSAKQSVLLSPLADPISAGQDATADYNDGAPASRRGPPLTSRIMVVSVSGDLAHQYISVMNAIFAAQRQKIPIDILKLAGDTVFLQQACDATGGVYVEPEVAEGLLQYLMMAFLPDATARRYLVMPGGGEVDFRAACFCHRKVVDVGFVCSVCLSIFCQPLSDGVCLTCNSRLSLAGAITPAPALFPRKKKKKKRIAGDGTSGASTPMQGVTPGPS
ncbi:transcription factor Tfb4 [Patellaria atrata CBS 101060]|uniref:General transcription and DNA repair factor IIH subunit TFB4 n=1 Tax=Patellaria atrata CBS 101060 TaxID=1346257 RepID=A0A9P4SH10_9PEZI|nr:transcription factor Tfb4 [Patellaria atrata CBS 101060]